MVFKTIGNKSNPVILFFHAMGVIGESSMPVAEKMKEKYYCIMPTSTVYCPGQRYQSKRDEIQQIVRFLENHGIKEIELAVASSIGADLAMAFLTEAKIPVKHVFFDGGQFAQIGKATRRIMVPFLYIAMKTSVYKGYKQDKIEMRGDRAEMSDFPLYLNTVAGGLDRRDQTIGGFSFVVKIYALPVVEIIGQLLYLLGRYGFNAQFGDCL